MLLYLCTNLCWRKNIVCRLSFSPMTPRCDPLWRAGTLADIIRRLEWIRCFFFFFSWSTKQRSWKSPCLFRWGEVVHQFCWWGSRDSPGELFSELYECAPHASLACVSWRVSPGPQLLRVRCPVKWSKICKKIDRCALPNLRQFVPGKLIEKKWLKTGQTNSNNKNTGELLTREAIRGTILDISDGETAMLHHPKTF